jgi:triosephosphate isomerase
MRTKVIAGNWKMNNDINGTIELISGIKSILAGKKIDAKLIVCPPFTSLETAKELFKGKRSLVSVHRICILKKMVHLQAKFRLQC